MTMDDVTFCDADTQARVERCLVEIREDATKEGATCGPLVVEKWPLIDGFFKATITMRRDGFHPRPCSAIWAGADFKGWDCAEKIPIRT